MFQDFSWQVPPGRTVLLGPNGAGKSTLLALGANALLPPRGKIQLLQAQGIDLFHTPIEEWQLDQPEVVTTLDRMRILVNQGAIFWYFADREEQILRERPPQEQFILDGQMGMWLSFFQLGTYSIDGTFQVKSLQFEVGKVPYPASEEFYKFVRGYIVSGAVGMWLNTGITTISFPVSFNKGRMIAADGTDISNNSDTEDSLNDSSSFEFDMAPLPVGQAGLSTNDFEVSGLHISAQTQDPQVCWEWLKFVSNDMRRFTRDIPVRISQSTSDDFATQSPQAGMLVQMYATALEQANQPVVANDMMDQLDFYWLFKAVDAAIQGEQELATGLATAQTTTEAFLACTLTGAAAYVCAQQVDPEYNGFNQPPDGDGS